MDLKRKRKEGVLKFNSFMEYSSLMNKHRVVLILNVVSWFSFGFNYFLDNKISLELIITKTLHNTYLAFTTFNNFIFKLLLQ